MRDESLRRLLFDDTEKKSSERAAFNSVDEFCSKYELHPLPGIDDEHFAERLFLHQAFVPAFGLAGLSYLTPQAPFVDSAKRQRRIDFLLDTGTRYALEVEGRRYHSSTNQDAERFDDEKSRQRELAKQGFRYTPFSFNDIRSGRAETLLGDMAVDDPVLHDLLRQRLQGSNKSAGATGNIHTLELLLGRLPQTFQDYQKAAFTMLFQAQHKAEIHLLDVEPELPLLPLAVLDSLSVLERVGELYGFPIKLPAVHIHTLRPSSPDVYWGLLKGYSLSNPAFPDAPRGQVAVTEAEMPKQVMDYTFAATQGRATPPEAVTPSQLSKFTAEFVAQVAAPPQEDTPVANVERHLLDFFARRYFTLPEVKPEQVHLVQRALLGQSGLGILPTGFGKSLVFQLYALMTPQTTLVISPLKALIRDQTHSMQRLGLSCVDAITGADSAAVKDKKLAAFKARQLRLLYISPERLQIKAFYEELRDSMQTTPVGAIIVDEAHCVSEWGHDFRPAYLQIGNLRGMLAEASGRAIPLLAMTATASELVREDIREVLHLSEDSVVQLASSDRPNLSLSVHPVASKEKPNMLTHLLKETLPNVLRLPVNELVPYGKAPPFQHAGVVFAVYANPHGRGTLPEGVHHIAKALREQVTLDPDQVRVHASTPPTVCPKCKSPLYVTMSGSEVRLAGITETNSKRCLACNEVFVRSGQVSHWDKTITENQDDFQNNVFPFLVATKGYGMGIDKRNLRFIVHHALSSGLEGYYQEAGRAGRDGQHSHVALMYAPPTTDCLTHLSSNMEPPCVSEKRNFMFHRCPYGLETLCDYGKQARFIRTSYGGIDQDVNNVLRVYDTLIQGKPMASDERRSDDENKDTQLALYRLQQLGIVQGYSLKYKSLTKVEFNVEWDADWTLQKVTGQLKELLLKFSYSQEQAEEKMSASPSNPPGPQRQVGTDNSAKRLEFLSTSVQILMERIYETVPSMRYYMLKNELDYATTTKCRRITLRSRFDEAPPGDDYQCGFCDVCNPDLRFARAAAAIPARDAQVEEVSKMLPELMLVFKRQDLDTVINTAVTRGAVAGMYARVVSRLESDATNLSALYLGGTLARRRPERQQEGWQLLKRGFQEGVIQGAALSDLVAFAHEASHVEKEKGFHLLTPVNGPFNTDEGLAIVQREAESILGEQAEASKTVRAVRRTRTLAKTADAVVEALESSVNDLLKGFDDLDGLDDLFKAVS
ncbi:DEAD/DEAH box helicase [Deinococcus sp.]|uniref:RecQ family ATP-dependent DNA helicase n=1 Tax=Deinococcus sp. TaxID=47478 RepID=UPI003B5C7076